MVPRGGKENQFQENIEMLWWKEISISEYSIKRFSLTHM